MRIICYRLCLGVFVLSIMVGGCSHKEPEVVVQNTLEDISSYEYDYYSGQNAAVSQFGKDSDSDLIVDLSNKRVISYTSDNNRQGYADGYHKALDILDRKNDPKCPDLH